MFNPPTARPYLPFVLRQPAASIRILRVWLALLVGLFTAVSSQAGHPAKVALQFAITQDVGSGNEVFVSGSHPDLSSGGILPFGVKLHWSPGNIWTGSIAVEAGAQITYGYFSHPLSNSTYCSASSTALGSNIPLTVAGAAGPPYPGKYIRYATTWAAPRVLFRDITANGNWTELPMQRLGQGRTVAEGIFEIASLAPAGDEIEFVFNDGLGHYDNAPAPPQNTPQGAAPAVPVPYQSLAPPYNYRTSLDVFFVQDGQLFNYIPPAAVSAPSITNRFVNSSVAGIPGRDIHIYLPRGYVQNTTKRYPVVYFHDGQNVFFPGGSFGTWDADRIANYEIGQGRMREAILVGIDNAGANRAVEYIPPGDQLDGYPAGTADKYVQFLRDNVLPTLDFNYRTLNQPGQPTQPAANITIGSSLGGLLTAYMGTVASSTFGKVGVVSPAFWAGPNFRNGALVSANKQPLKIYMDIGSMENSTSQSNSNIYWLDAFSVYNDWVDDGYVINTEMLMYSKCGANHNEGAWSLRLPVFYKFALSLWDEANSLALSKYPPRLEVTQPNAANGTARLRFLAPLGVPFTLSRSPDLANWPDQSAIPAAGAIWEDRIVDESFTPTNRRFWRLSY